MVMVDHFLNEMLKIYSLFLNQCFFVNRKTELFLLETLFFFSLRLAPRCCGFAAVYQELGKKEKNPSTRGIVFVHSRKKIFWFNLRTDLIKNIIIISN